MLISSNKLCCGVLIINAGINADCGALAEFAGFPSMKHFNYRFSKVIITRQEYGVRSEFNFELELPVAN